MASVPDPIEVVNFKMKQLCTFRVSDRAYDVQETASLVATSKYGLVFIGTPTTVRIIKVSDLVQIDDGFTKKTEISSYPFKEILLPSSPSFVALSSDNLTLMVCLKKSGCPVGWLYDVRGFARETGNWNPFQEVRLSSTEGTSVRDCAWNPTIPGLVAVSISDGSLVLVEINNTQFTINSLPPTTGVQAISWSPKGKQLVAARPGKIVQYKPDLKEAKTTPFNGDDVHMSQPSVCGLQWLSTSQFLVAFVDQSDPNSRPHLHIVNVQKSPLPAIFLDYDDVCYGNSYERPHKYLTLGIPQWNVLLACSANAIEIAVLAQTGVGGSENPEWRQWTLDDDLRALLPMDLKNDGAETKPMGMAIDTTSQNPIQWLENRTLPPVPILFILSTHGLLCPFHVLNQVDGAASVNVPPEQLLADNERPGMTLKVAQTAPPLAASTPLPVSAKPAIQRTNLGERFAAFADTPSTGATAKLPLPKSGAEPFFANKPQTQSFPQPLTTIKPMPAPLVPPTKIELAPAVSKPIQAPVKLVNPVTVEESSSMNAAAEILRDEIAKFEQEMKEFKARSSTLNVTIASEEEKQRLLKMTAELSEFGKELVDTTKVQDEEVRGLCTDLVEVAALLEDARVIDARRKNSRFNHLLKFRPLDPASRRKMDNIDRLHAHIEQQLVEAGRNLDSIQRDRNKDQNRRIEIPTTQVIYETIKNHSKVIARLESKVQRIKIQSNEQQLKLAGAAFEALRPKSSEDVSGKWDSELAVLADSLLPSARTKVEGKSQSTHPVLPQVSPEKQALLRSVLANRPVTRIRAVRPESVAESRLLSNLSGLILSDDKKDNSISTAVSQVSSKIGLLAAASAPGSTQPSTSDCKPQSSQMGIGSSGAAAAAVVPKTSSSRVAAAPKLAPRPAAEVEDITPPSSPLNLDQKAKALGNQQMMSSLSLPSRVPAPTISETKPPISFKVNDVKPSVASLPASVPPPYEPKPAFSMPASNPPAYEPKSNFSLPTPTPDLLSHKSDAQAGLGSTSLFGKSSFASAFSSATATATNTTTSPIKPVVTVSSSFASLGTSTPTLPSVKPQATSTAAPAPFSFAIPPASSATTTATIKPTDTSLKTSFSFNSLASISAPTASATSTPTQAPIATSVPAIVTTTPTAAPTSSFTFSSTSLPPSTTAPSAVMPAPFSFVTPQPSQSPVTSSDAQSSATKPAVPPSSFSFSLPKTQSSSTTNAGATPFSFSLSGNASTTASSTSSVFASPVSTPAAGPLFSLSSATKTPTAFGVVNAATTATTPVSTASNSPFGQVPVSTAVATTSAPVVAPLFGQPVSTPAAPASTPDTGLVPLLFDQSKLGSSLAPSTPVTQTALGALASAASTGTTITPATNTLFGQPATTAAGSLFGQPSTATTASPFSSSFGQSSVFGQTNPATPTPAQANAPVFGQATFGQPAQTTAAAATTFGSPPVFGQTSGFSAGSVFGQGGSSTTTPVKPLFGGSAFGQAPANTSVASPNAGFGSMGFGNMGLGGTPSAANANRNAFGGGTVFGGTPSAQGSFGSPSVSSPFGGQPAAAAAPPPAFGSPTPGFGAFGQSSPAFGAAATFGGSPLFGSKPTFGGGATFGSPVASIPAAKPETGGFGAFAAANNVPTFGVLASSGNAQPAFGGASFPSTNPPTFGGGSSFSSWR